jgi:hypothetical protein
MSIVVPLLDAEQLAKLPDRAREVIEYRKSGLSLNHIQGCPLDCAYCIRHAYGLWDERQPRALMSCRVAVRAVISNGATRARGGDIPGWNGSRPQIQISRSRDDQSFRRRSARATVAGTLANCPDFRVRRITV